MPIGVELDLPSGIGDPIVMLWLFLYALGGFAFWFTAYLLAGFVWMQSGRRIGRARFSRSPLPF